jgi:DNA-binding response OmpR family regulator
VHVRRLREKVEADPTLPQRIVTVLGVGYRYEPETA